ncbi:MAG: DUF305 domain-containing protein, partial [Aquihabitans sp.]
MPETAASPPDIASPARNTPDTSAQSPRGIRGRFGPLTGARVAVLLVAFMFLGGAIGWSVGQRSQDPLSSTDVGFMLDMGFHHEQAVQLSLLVLANDTVSPDLKRYAQEIIISQQAERGIFNATLDRFNHPSSPGDEVMGWMLGHPVPRDEMEGLASDAEMEKLAAATGDDAESLWISLMSEHHLGGLHMADWAARHGHDCTTRNVAKSSVKVQRDE